MPSQQSSPRPSRHASPLVLAEQRSDRWVRTALWLKAGIWLLAFLLLLFLTFQLLALLR